MLRVPPAEEDDDEDYCAGRGATAAAAAPAAEGGSVWQAIADPATRATYYYNTKTGQSVWEMPPEMAAQQR